jgi:hypothetical protein
VSSVGSHEASGDHALHVHWKSMTLGWFWLEAWYTLRTQPCVCCAERARAFASVYAEGYTTRRRNDRELLFALPIPIDDDADDDGAWIG